MTAGPSSSISLAIMIVVGASVADAQPTNRPPNLVVMLSDDHRYDFMSFLEQAPDFLETPHLDRMAVEGAHLRQAFVTTSLCSPSRASILTGRYMHAHRVVDNQRPVPAGTVFFPQYLQEAGYRTAFVGKWHMGHDDDQPRPGFDHWVSFHGQGEYFDPVLNINGQTTRFVGYNTDILTNHALDWMRQISTDSQPFFLFLAFKSVHYPFRPAPRHRGRYRDARIDFPQTMARSQRNYQTQPRWVRERRYSIHGIDHMETGRFDQDPVPSLAQLYKDYAETVYSMDENIGRVLDFLGQHDLRESTLVVYLGDNGFALGEHGFYDKRDAFEPSIRIPLLAYAPGRIAPGTQVDAMVLNTDLAPTLLDVAGVRPPAEARFDGRSFLPLLKGTDVPWRDHMLYEYHWEWNFPATPSLFAIRTQRYKFIFYHGVWDRNGLYDLQTDPHEQHNLVDVPGYAEQVKTLQRQLFDELDARNALNIPVRRPAGERLDDRKLPR